MGYDTSFQALLAAGWDEEAAADIARIKVEEDAKAAAVRALAEQGETQCEPS